MWNRAQNQAHRPPKFRRPSFLPRPNPATVSHPLSPLFVRGIFLIRLLSLTIFHHRRRLDSSSAAKPISPEHFPTPPTHGRCYRAYWSAQTIPLASPSPHTPPSPPFMLSTLLVQAPHIHPKITADAGAPTPLQRQQRTLPSPLKPPSSPPSQAASSRHLIFAGEPPEERRRLRLKPSPFSPAGEHARTGSPLQPILARHVTICYSSLRSKSYFWTYFHQFFV
jgi:hypothetical protein